MHILLTGNKGYIGSVLAETLLGRGYKITGYDTGYYADCGLYEALKLANQIHKDIRDVDENDMCGVDAVIHLAAISNDPLGELNPFLTEEINLHGSVRLARLAKEAGINRFIYASSQSMYGVAETENELDEDTSIKNPVTEYARTKWLAEEELKKLNDENFTVVCLRPSTVFGASPMLRCDIVFNNFVACAYTTGRVEIKSDGTPWRPVVHVKDVTSAFLATLEAPVDLVAGESFNVGIRNGNYTVRDLAEAARRAVPGSTLVFTGEHGSDSRTYRVSFAKIFSKLGDYYKPEWNLDRGAAELVSLFQKVGFSENHFRGERCNRLRKIRNLMDAGRLNNSLRWT